MRVVVVGVGTAGGRIVDEFVAYTERDGATTVVEAFAIDSTTAGLGSLAHVPSENRVLVGDGTLDGRGTGANLYLGADLVNTELVSVQELLKDVPVETADAILVVAGLGGGTGGGGAPILAEHLSWLYTVPVYGVGILPSESESGIRVLNAAGSSRSLTHTTTSLIVFDNDTWLRRGDDSAVDYDTVNEAIVERLAAVFRTPQSGSSDDATHRLRAADVTETLSRGNVSTIGYASDTAESRPTALCSKLSGDDTDGGLDTTSAEPSLLALVDAAAADPLSGPPGGSCERTLLICSGPPERLTAETLLQSRRRIGADSVPVAPANRSHGRTPPPPASVSTRSCPTPNRTRVTATVLRSGLQDVVRLDTFRRLADELDEHVDEIRRAADGLLDPGPTHDDGRRY